MLNAFQKAAQGEITWENQGTCRSKRTPSGTCSSNKSVLRAYKTSMIELFCKIDIRYLPFTIFAKKIPASMFERILNMSLLLLQVQLKVLLDLLVKIVLTVVSPLSQKNSSLPSRPNLSPINLKICQFLLRLSSFLKVSELINIFFWANY